LEVYPGTNHLSILWYECPKDQELNPAHAYHRRLNNNYFYRERIFFSSKCSVINNSQGSESPVLVMPFLICARWAVSTQRGASRILNNVEKNLLVSPAGSNLFCFLPKLSTSGWEFPGSRGVCRYVLMAVLQKRNLQPAVPVTRAMRQWAIANLYFDRGWNEM
jgi:hypothetical protein